MILGLIIMCAAGYALLLKSERQLDFANQVLEKYNNNNRPPAERPITDESTGEYMDAVDEDPDQEYPDQFEAP